MNKLSIITWVSLIILTIISGVFSNIENRLVVLIIIGLATIKFLGVAFQFMELKKAHSFWKSSIVVFIFIFTALIWIIH